jgi:multisubunit Na+/H+ antiporter MnhG subunit
MAPFFAVWAVYFFLHGVRRYSDEKKFPALFYAGIGGLFLGLGMYSYIAFRVMPLVFVAMVPFFAKHKGFWKCAAVLATAAILVAAPIGLYYLENPADFMGRTAQVSVLSSAAPLKDLGLNALKTLGMFNFAGDWNWRHNFAGRPEVFWPVGIFLWAGAILALRAIWKKFAHGEDKGYAMASSLMSAWAAMAALPVIASNEGLPHALRAILLIPPAMLFAGWGADRIYQKIVRLSHAFHTGDRLAKTARLASAALFVMLAAEGATTYFLLWGKNPNVQGAFAAEQVELGKKLLSLPDEAPKYVVVKARGVDVRGIPMPAQTVMFVTDTFLPESRAARNIHYVLPEEEQNIPLGAMKFYIE